jgi:hypothetical protein
MAMQEAEQFRRISLGKARSLREELGPGDRIKVMPENGTEAKRTAYIHDPYGILVFGSTSAGIVRKS